MIERFKRATSLLKPVVVVGAVWNRLVGQVEWLSRLQVGGGLRLEAGPSGPIILGPPPANVTESTGEFQWQNRIMVSQNQAGWDDARATAILEDG